VAAAVTTTLRLGTFTKSVVLAVARETDLLSMAGLEVEEVSVVSSPAQFSALAAGELDAVLTSPDNVLLYSAGTPNPVGRLLDLTMYAGIDHGTGLSLWAAPGVDAATATALTMAVDVPTSGFAFAGFALAQRCGLCRDDLTVVALGSTPNRARALIAGECDITILNASNELRAAASGCTMLGSVTAVGPYLGTVLAGRRGELVSDLRRLRTALLAAIHSVLTTSSDEWLLDLIASTVELTPDQARQHLEVLRSTSDGLVATGEIDEGSLRGLLQLRAAAGDTTVSFDPHVDGRALVDEGFWMESGGPDVG